jgi:WD40 repeat protein
MSEQFKFDVFLSHSSKDKAIVRNVAQRLRKDGLKVWFDEWEIKPGDNIPAKIEEGLEYSRVLVLCMSAHAFGSDWAQLETGTFRFRDPVNKERRFIPLRLDDAPIKGSLSQFSYINWLPADKEQEYTKLLSACHTSKLLTTEVSRTGKLVPEKAVQLKYKAMIRAYAFDLNGKQVVTGGEDKTVRLWDMNTGDCLRVFQGHIDDIWSIAWSADQCYVLSGSWDKTVRVWDMKTGHSIHVFKDHTDRVWSVSWSMDGKYILSGSQDKTMRLWDVKTGRCLYVFEGHTSGIRCVAWSHDQSRVFSGSWDKTVRLWDVKTGHCLHVFEDNSNDVHCIESSNDNRRTVFGANDKAMRLWDIETRLCLRVFKGHMGDVDSLAWNADHRHVLSSSEDKTVRLWDVETGRCLCVLKKGHKYGLRCAVWNADQRHIFSGDSMGGICVWDLSGFFTESQSPKVCPVEKTKKAGKNSRPSIFKIN